MDRPATLTDEGREEQERIKEWALLSAFAWTELKAYDEIPEGTRAELLIAWLGTWLGRE